jgi:hypothetical protein
MAPSPQRKKEGRKKKWSTKGMLSSIIGGFFFAFSGI